MHTNLVSKPFQPGLLYILGLLTLEGATIPGKAYMDSYLNLVRRLLILLSLWRQVAIYMSTFIYHVPFLETSDRMGQRGLLSN